MKSFRGTNINCRWVVHKFIHFTDVEATNRCMLTVESTATCKKFRYNQLHKL